MQSRFNNQILKYSNSYPEVAWFFKVALVNLCVGWFLSQHRPGCQQWPLKTTILAWLNHISHEHRLTAFFSAAPTSNNTQQMAFNTASYPWNWEIQKQFWSNKWERLNGLEMQMQPRSWVHVSDRDSKHLALSIISTISALWVSCKGTPCLHFVICAFS